jgi:cation transport regulator ChaB
MKKNLIRKALNASGSAYKDKKESYEEDSQLQH